MCAWHTPVCSRLKAASVIPPGKAVYPACWYWTPCLQRTAAGTWRPGWSPYRALSEETNTQTLEEQHGPTLKSYSFLYVCWTNALLLLSLRKLVWNWKRLVSFHLWKLTSWSRDTFLKHCEGDSCDCGWERTHEKIQKGDSNYDQEFRYYQKSWTLYRILHDGGLCLNGCWLPLNYHCHTTAHTLTCTIHAVTYQYWSHHCPYCTHLPYWVSILILLSVLYISDLH